MGAASWVKVMDEQIKKKKGEGGKENKRRRRGLFSNIASTQRKESSFFKSGTYRPGA